MPEHDTNEQQLCFFKYPNSSAILDSALLRINCLFNVHSKWNTDRNAVTAGDLITWQTRQTLLGRVLMPRTLTLSKGQGLSSTAFTWTDECVFFPVSRIWMFHSVTFLVRTSQKQANRECKHNKATDRYTRIVSALHMSSMFVKFGLHEAGAGGILNTTLWRWVKSPTRKHHVVKQHCRWSSINCTRMRRSDKHKDLPRFIWNAKFRVQCRSLSASCASLSLCVCACVRVLGGGHCGPMRTTVSSSRRF
jgi:hypothetical protein